MRYEWVNYAKSIGIILVVYGHVSRGLVNGGLMTASSAYQLIDSIIYSFHMPLFFFLSGIFVVSSFTRKGGGEFLLSKVDTVAYPFVLWSLLQGTIEVLLSKYTNGNVTFGVVLNLFVEPRAQFWFLYALFIAFVCAGVVLKVFGRRAIVPALFISSSLYVYQGSFNQSNIIGFIANNLVYLFLGMSFMKLDTSRLNSLRLIFSLWFLMAALQYYFHMVLGLNYMDKGWVSLFLSTVSVLSIVSLSMKLSEFKLTKFEMIGASSMAIYVMHILAGSGARVILHKLWGVESVALHLITGSVLGIFLPLLSLSILKKLNVRFVLSAPLSSLAHKIRGDRS